VYDQKVADELEDFNSRLESYWIPFFVEYSSNPEIAMVGTAIKMLLAPFEPKYGFDGNEVFRSSKKYSILVRKTKIAKWEWVITAFGGGAPRSKVFCTFTTGSNKVHFNQTHQDAIAYHDFIVSSLSHRLERVADEEEI